MSKTNHKQNICIYIYVHVVTKYSGTRRDVHFLQQLLSGQLPGPALAGSSRYLNRVTFGRGQHSVRRQEGYKSAA